MIAQAVLPKFGEAESGTGKGPAMYYELTWLGVVLSVVGAAALGVPFARFIARAVRNRDSARKDRGSLSRRLGPEADRS